MTIKLQLIRDPYFQRYLEEYPTDGWLQPLAAAELILLMSKQYKSIKSATQVYRAREVLRRTRCESPSDELGDQRLGRASHPRRAGCMDGMIVPGYSDGLYTGCVSDEL